MCCIIIIFNCGTVSIWHTMSRLRPLSDRLPHLDQVCQKSIQPLLGVRLLQNTGYEFRQWNWTQYNIRRGRRIRQSRHGCFIHDNFFLIRNLTLTPELKNKLNRRRPSSVNPNNGIGTAIICLHFDVRYIMQPLYA